MKGRGIKLGVHGPSQRAGDPGKPPRVWAWILKNYSLKSKGKLDKQPSQDLGPT